MTHSEIPHEVSLGLGLKLYLKMPASLLFCHFVVPGRNYEVIYDMFLQGHRS